MIGTPDECIDKIREFQAMTHAQEFVFICQFGGMPMDRAEKSMRLFADKVLPEKSLIGWRTADLMWRIAGDTSTDFNHYTKRMTLGAVYGSTLLVWLDDQSEGWSETAAFLDRRIDDVMKFEKFKADWRGSSTQRLSLSRFLGRLRYPPR